MQIRASCASWPVPFGKERPLDDGNRNVVCAIPCPAGGGRHDNEIAPAASAESRLPARCEFQGAFSPLPVTAHANAQSAQARNDSQSHHNAFSIPPFLRFRAFSLVSQGFSDYPVRSAFAAHWNPVFFHCLETAELWREHQPRRNIPLMRCPYCESQNVALAPESVQSHALQHPVYYQCGNCGKRISVTKAPRPGAANRPSPSMPKAQVFRRARGNPRGARGR